MLTMKQRSFQLQSSMFNYQRTAIVTAALGSTALQSASRTMIIGAIESANMEADMIVNTVHASTAPMAADEVIHRLRNLQNRLNDDGDNRMAACVLQSISIIEQQRRDLIAARGVAAAGRPRVDPRTISFPVTEAKRSVIAKRSTKPGKKRRVKTKYKW
jgi:hypothetical protein